MTKSVAFLKFRTLLEQEIRTFWHVMASLEYAERWLSSNAAPRLTLFPGDNKYPFRAIDIPPAEFIAGQPAVAQHIRENALVSFVTTFECFLFELLERLIYIQPDLVSDSDMQISVKQLAIAVPEDMRRWLAAKVADKYLRNKTHAEMIFRLDTLCKAGVSKQLSAEVAEWSLWSLARNSIVHTSRQVTVDLSKAWPTRFPTSGGQLNLQNKELARVHHLALKIAAAIDARAIASVIHKKDELLIARELFVQRGIDQPNALKSALSRVVSVKSTRPELERMLAEKRRGNNADRWELSVRDLGLIAV
ncbi:hypothetical protein [Burkholderia multivorans]|uniref:hypothetical protein n=1 Tax=Burkholderia multivorans TaxID=87883 RepID=UPI001C24908D|nr:hypothetical protein [Burkholderia multivorans]MBU9454707.1 hypothetical protein [Burkholderia multivorans]